VGLLLKVSRAVGVPVFAVLAMWQEPVVEGLGQQVQMQHLNLQQTQQVEVTVATVFHPLLLARLSLAVVEQGGVESQQAELGELVGVETVGLRAHQERLGPLTQEAVEVGLPLAMELMVAQVLLSSLCQQELALLSLVV